MYMETQIPRKIHIIGSVGSGKTTLARSLSARMGSPFYELDNVVWIRADSGDIRRGDKDRDSLLGQITHHESWVIEGAHYHYWVHTSLQAADLIVFLNPSYYTRSRQIVKRFIKQRLGAENANYKPTFAMLKKMFEWNNSFEHEGKDKIIGMLQDYADKVIVVRSGKQFLEQEMWLMAARQPAKMIR